MNAVLRRRFEMAARVRDFLRAHKTEGAEAAALTRLEQLLTRAEVLATQQRAGVVAARGSIEQRAEVRRALQGKLLRDLGGVGAGGGGGEGGPGGAVPRARPRATKLACVTPGQGDVARPAG